jgi:hypothetical protein
MKNLLERLQLIDFFVMEIEAEKSTFVKRFKENVDEGSTGLMFSSFEIFNSGKNEYKGLVNYDGFKIRRKKKLFDMNVNMAIAQGTYRQKDNLLVIETEVNGFHPMLIAFFVVVFMFYLVFFFGFFFSDPQLPWFFIPFIILHAAFMFGLPYLLIRRSIKRMKYELEREFFYMTKP